MKDVPVCGIDTHEKVLEFIDTNISSSSKVEEEHTKLVHLQTHRHSTSCKKKGKEVCRFGFPLPPKENKTMILEPFDSDIGDETLKANKQFLDKCEVTYEQYTSAVISSLQKKQVMLKRSMEDVRINSYNLHLLKIRQANTDLQYVIDPWAAFVHIASYIMKSQRRMSQLLQAAAEKATRGNLKLRDKVRLTANKFLNHCKISAKEAIYLLLQLPLIQRSRDVIFINTSPPDKRIQSI